MPPASSRKQATEVPNRVADQLTCVRMIVRLDEPFNNFHVAHRLYLQSRDAALGVELLGLARTIRIEVLPARARVIFASAAFNFIKEYAESRP